MTTRLELLSPAGTAAIGIAAIDHGADAVYIGAPKFSARRNAGNAAADIERLIHHAHLYYAKVYVALNTILTDEEIVEARDIIQAIYELGADGLIVQDRGLLELALPPIPLIASTQMHNDTPDKVRFLEEAGFSRVILARELSLAEIAAVRQAAPHIELEVFVHGSLCVSYSGQCYMSQAIAGRSGNRGACAQPCRLRYSLIDGAGQVVVENKYLLSLKDLNLMNDLAALVQVGVTSFKIEGRYKEIEYVKNVTAAWRVALDRFIAGTPADFPCEAPPGAARAIYVRASSGASEFAFTPDPERSFNRGFTRYFIDGGRARPGSLHTQKSLGKAVGSISRTGRDFFYLDGEELHNGDGLCFFTPDGELAGFRVENTDGGKIFPNTMRGLAVGVSLYRNYDIAFNRILARPDSARRRIDVVMELRQDELGVNLRARDEDGNLAELSWPFAPVAPRVPDREREKISKQLAASGNTPFRVGVKLLAPRPGYFPVSRLNQMRRQLLELLEKIRAERRPRRCVVHNHGDSPYPEPRIDYHGNVLNRLARRFYRRHGVRVIAPAFETLPEVRGLEVMRTRYCVREQLGACLRTPDAARQLRAPLRLRDYGHCYRLDFDCVACCMTVTLEK